MNNRQIDTIMFLLLFFIIILNISMGYYQGDIVFKVAF
jgi:hypothetical protein